MSGGLAYDVAHLVGGGVLLASFLLLYQRRVVALISVLAAQGALVALAAAWLGLVRGEAHLFATAAITAAVKAVLVPLLLRGMVRRLDLDRAVETALPVGGSLALGVGLVALSVLVVLPATAGSAGALARADMAMALSVLLLGILMMATRRTAIPQVVGLIAAENGLLLAAIGISLGWWQARSMRRLREALVATIAVLSMVVGLSEVAFNINNTNDITLTTSRIEYELFADGASLGTDTLSYEDVPLNGRPPLFPNSPTTVTDTFRLDYSDQRAELFDRVLNSSDQINWRVSGTATVESGTTLLQKTFSDEL